MGKTTLRQVIRSVDERNAVPASAVLQRCGCWRALLDHALGALGVVDRAVLSGRVGLSRPKETLAALAKALDRSRERVRQIEGRAARRLRAASGWAPALRQRLESLLDEPVVVMDELAARDAFFQIDEADRSAFEFFVRALLGIPVFVVAMRGRTFLSYWDQAELDHRCHEIAGAARALRYPLRRARLPRTLAARLGWPPDYAALFVRLFAGDWSCQGDRVLGYGAGAPSVPFQNGAIQIRLRSMLPGP